MSRSRNLNTVKRTSRRQPIVERLESRWCPAVTVVQLNNTLQVNGDAEDDAIEIIDRGGGNVDLVAGDTSDTFTQVNTIVVNSLGGDDAIQVVLDPGDSSYMAVLEVNSGADDDTVSIQGPAPRIGNSPVIRDEQLTYAIDLGTGDDVLSVAIHQFNAIDLDVTAASGNDDVAIGLLLPAVQKVSEATATLDVELDGIGNSVNLATRNYDVVNAAISIDSATVVDGESENQVSLSFLRVDPSDPSAPSLSDELTVVVQMGASDDTIVVNSHGFHNLDSSIQAGDGENSTHVLHRVAGGTANAAAVDAVFGSGDDVVSLALLGYDDVTTNISTGGGSDTITPLFQRNGRAGSGELNLTLASGDGDDRIIANAIGYHDVTLSTDTGVGDDEIVASFLESFRRGRDASDTSSLQLTINLGAGDDRSTLLSRGYASINTSTDTGPAGEGNDRLTAMHLAAVAGFFRLPRLRRSVTELDGDLDISGIVTLGYSDVDIQTGTTLQTAAISD